MVLEEWVEARMMGCFGRLRSLLLTGCCRTDLVVAGKARNGDLVVPCAWRRKYSRFLLSIHRQSKREVSAFTEQLLP
jgi:hypothetical protein